MSSLEMMCRRATILVGSVVLLAGQLSTAPTLAAAPPALDAAAIDDHVRGMIDAWAVPGAAIAIVRDGAVIHTAAFGEAAEGRAMTTDTPVVIGSVGKSITALAVRQLIEAGRLDIHAPVGRYLPWFMLEGPSSATDAITIGDLLRHTSGLSTAAGQDVRWYEPGLTPEHVARGLADVRPDRPVGTYGYSNLNYVLLGVVVEAVSGQGYGDYVRQHIFEPLGMRQSHTDLAAPDAATIATGHRYVFGVPVAFDEPYPSGIVPAGYQISSAEDMAHFVAALANGGIYGGVDLVSPGRRSGPDPAFGTDWQPLGSTDPGMSSGQSGATLVTNTDILVMPAERLGVVVLMNANPIQLGVTGGAAEVASDVLSLALGQRALTAAPGVRQVYLVIDTILLVLLALLGIHVLRARTWTARLAATRHPRLLLCRTVVADLILPLVVLVGLGLAIGWAGSSPPGDVVGGWRFVLWTLPDLGIALLILATVPLILGGWKAFAWWTRSRHRIGSTVGRVPAAS